MSKNKQMHQALSAVVADHINCVYLNLTNASQADKLFAIEILSKYGKQVETLIWDGKLNTRVTAELENWIKTSPQLKQLIINDNPIMSLKVGQQPPTQQLKL